MSGCLTPKSDPPARAPTPMTRPISRGTSSSARRRRRRRSRSGRAGGVACRGTHGVPEALGEGPAEAEADEVGATRHTCGVWAADGEGPADGETLGVVLRGDSCSAAAKRLLVGPSPPAGPSVLL